MKTYLSIMLIIGLFSCKQESPRLQVEKLGAAIDTIRTNAPQEVKFKLTNNFNQDITIKKYAAACPCTSSEMGDDFVIPARSSKEIAFKVDPGKMNKGQLSIVDISLRTDAKPELYRLQIKALAIDSSAKASL